MSATLIAQRYAQALLGSLDEQGGDAQTALAALRDWAAWLAEGSNAAVALSSPVIPPDAQAKLLDTLLTANETDKLVGAFLKLALDKGRLNVLGAIADQVQAILDERAGVARGTVTTAYEVDDALKGEITTKLQGILNRTPELQWATDASLLGGFKVQVGHRIWNASLQHQLERLGETIRKGVR